MAEVHSSPTYRVLRITDVITAYTLYQQEQLTWLTLAIVDNDGNRDDSPVIHLVPKICFDRHQFNQDQVNILLELLINSHTLS